MYTNEESLEEIEEKKAWDSVRIRNLKINIAKVLIRTNNVSKEQFTRNELVELFAFKEYDIKYLSKEIFEDKNGAYSFTNNMREFLVRVFKSNSSVQKYQKDAETVFLRLYGSFYDEVKRSSFRGFSSERYNIIFSKIKEYLPILHWAKLPVFNKYLLYNRSIDPETKTIDFYNHPDCLDALLKEVRGKGIVLSNKSDLSLNKEMSFEVFTRRWGHNDRYTINRTIDGWHCGYLSINGNCKKDGEGALFQNLDHDSVFFPRDGVKYAMQELWEAADSGDINFEELSKRLQEVADWISTVERSITAQPQWVNYY